MDGPNGEPSIAELVMAGLANGLLWIIEAKPVWVGPGLYKPCIVCRQRITRYEIQYDVPGPRGALPAHAACYSLWLDFSYQLRNDRRADP